MQFTTEAVFERPITDDPESDLSRITAYFHTRAFILSEGHSVDFQEVVDVLNELVSNFSTRGSGYVLAYVKSLKISLVPFRPLGASDFGGTYIKTPRWLAVKHAAINVRNNDERCFLWAILSALYPVDQNTQRVKKYKRYENTLDTRDLEFPVAPNKIHVFERRNPSIAIHCLAYDEKTKSFSVLYMSQEIHNREHKITLLLLDSPDDNRKHYVYVKHLSRLIRDRDTARHKHHVCLSCLQTFTSERVLKNHTQLIH